MSSAINRNFLGNSVSVNHERFVVCYKYFERASRSRLCFVVCFARDGIGDSLICAHRLSIDRDTAFGNIRCRFAHAIIVVGLKPFLGFCAYTSFSLCVMRVLFIEENCAQLAKRPY